MSQNVCLLQKIIITIVKKGRAEKVIRAAKDAGSEGATVIFARGSDAGPKGIFSLDYEQEREMVINLVLEEYEEAVVNGIVRQLNLSKPNQGILFCLDAAACIGIVHLKDKGGNAVLGAKSTHDLIFTIVNRGDSDKVVNASKASGARGGTILCGRGTGVHEKAKLLGIPIEPEKEIILTLIEKDFSDRVLAAISEAAELDTPGKGIAFVLNVSRVEGIVQHKKLP